MKRIFLLIATNIAVMVVLSLVIQVFGLDRYLAQKGMNLTGLLVISAVFGFGGAFISLLISKWMAKRAMGVQVITNPANETERWLVNTVAQQAQTAGIGMPEVGIFDSPDPNAFATGANKNSALVAVSTGLLRNMRREEVEAVLGHEISHVANGDMVTLTLIQGVMNTFVFFLARVIGGIVDKRHPQERARQRHRLFRHGDRRADRARLPGRHGRRLVLAQARIPRGRGWRASGGHQLDDRRARGAQACPFPYGVAGADEGLRHQRCAPPTGLQRCFMSHPPLDERIAALNSAR